MNKIVPDPPHPLFGKTAMVAFGHCKAGHTPMFTVRAEIDTEDALVHASLLMKGVHDTLQQLSELAQDVPRNGLIFSSLYSAEMAKGLVDAVIDGIEMGRLGVSA